jgi:hypothetical protein
MLVKSTLRWVYMPTPRQPVTEQAAGTDPRSFHTPVALSRHFIAQRSAKVVAELALF